MFIWNQIGRPEIRAMRTLFQSSSVVFSMDVPDFWTVRGILLRDMGRIGE